jgi:ABC-type transporter Mla maintaining outer membrane lipid asymmetry ATPase subunit MlaF
LDPIVAQQVCELIVNLNRKTATTILIVTHDLHNAFRVATRMAVLDEGRIVEEGPPVAIRQSRNPVMLQFMAAALDS